MEGKQEKDTDTGITQLWGLIETKVYTRDFT